MVNFQTSKVSIQVKLLLSNWIKRFFVQMKQSGEKLINTFPGTIKYMHVIFGFYEINYILLNYLFYMEIVLSIY